MRDVSNYLVRPESNLHEVIETIDRGAAQIALVVDASRKLLGVVTDGDIRRALLRGETLASLARDVMFMGFRSVPHSTEAAEAFSLMCREKLRQVPVLDDTGCVVMLFLVDDFVQPKRLTNPVVIMAGGEGKRLHPLTHNCPKPMLSIGGKPMLEIILGQCIDAGFQTFFLSVNYLKDQIKEYFGDGSRWNVNIEYLEEVQPLGTAGALSLLQTRSIESILVLNGDILTRVDYARLLQFHDEAQQEVTVCVREHEMQIPYGVVQLHESQVVSVEEKPLLRHHVNAGIYLLNPMLLDLVPANRFFDMPQLLEKALQNQFGVNAFPIHEQWLDVGHPETLKLAYGEWQ